MAYQALILQMLISAPGDVEPKDLAIVRKTVSQWNNNFGKAVGLAVLPVSWTEHAASEFGDRPQALLNGQLVDEADFAIALFRDRLGTPTGKAESGTAEEISILAENEKSVGVFVDASLRKPLDSSGLEERQRLATFVAELKEKSLVFDYSDSAALVGHVNNFLSRSTAKFQQSVEQSKEESSDAGFDPSVGVWPRAEVRELVSTDSRGRLKTNRKWELVLENTSPGPASNVDFKFEGLPEEVLFEVHRDEGPIGTIPPGKEVRFPLLLAWGSPSAVECIVNWTDVNGKEHQTLATVRT